jgi:hypothetical protein
MHGAKVKAIISCHTNSGRYFWEASQEVQFVQSTMEIDYTSTQDSLLQNKAV